MSKVIISARASELFRLEICPGSYRMQKGLPDEDTELSKKGSMLHWYDAHPELDRSFLRPQDQDLLETAKSLDNIVIQRVTEQFALKDESFREEREIAGKYSEDGFEITGHPDRIQFYERGLTVIFEKKFGFLDQSPADVNKQLRGYSLIFSKGDSVVSMLQPRKPYDEQVTIAHYTKADIESSRQEITSILDECRKPDASLNATEAGCRYCRAKLICPAFKEQFLSVAVGLNGNTLATAQHSLAKCSDTDLDRVLTAIQFADFIKEAARDEARSRIQAGALTNWILGKAAETRKIADPARAIALLALQGDLTREEILDCSSPALGRLEEKLREKKGFTWKKAKDTINQCLSSVLVNEAKKPSLIRKKT